MKFIRNDLIARVEAEISRRDKIAADRTAQARQEHEQRRAEYIDRTNEAWKAFATTIRRRVGKGLTVRDDDIPTCLRDGRNGYVRTFSNKPPAEHTAITHNLATLLDLLKSCTDDTVTTTSLERMGFRMAQLFHSPLT